MSKLFNLFDLSQKVNYKNEVLSGLTVALALENAIKDALDARCQVFVLCPHQDTQAQLDRLSVSEMVPKSQFLDSRQAALEAALNVVESTQLHA